MTEIDFKAIEEKWQRKWEEEAVFIADGSSDKPRYYVLEMFPYPSGSGLHMGHAWNYTIGDILARFKIMNGFNVLHPMGYDALGLPAENAAIKAGSHPEDYNKNSIQNYIKQQKALGLTYDWSRMISTDDSKFYKWDQWIFLKMLEKGLAYQKESAVNWCPKCNTVLANEQVQDGKCWRHDDTDVEVKHLKQWFLKITDYADELYENLDNMDWPDRTKSMQKHWIGKSYGTEIDFEVGDLTGKEFIFLHGYKYGMEDDFWKWLEKEIVYYGGKVVFKKELPNKLKPNLKEQIDFVLNSCSFNENTIIVSHSLGNVLTMKLLPEIECKIKKWVAVAPPASLVQHSPEERPVISKYCDWIFDPISIKKNVGEINILVNEYDDSRRISSAQYLSDLLEVESNFVCANNVHFNSEEEPVILNQILPKEKWPVFTTRPDTIFGVTFVVVSAQHKKLWDLVTDEQKPEVEKFLKKLGSVSEKEMADMEKEGVFTGSYAVNPANGEKVPIYAGNFVVADYGSGMVMAVPAHDKRDFEFAHKYGIDIKPVVNPVDFEYGSVLEEAYTGEGTLMNSGEFDDLKNDDAKKKITGWLESKGVGRSTLNFRLRDWGISRQRYWGTPIPIIYCDKCGSVPVSEKDLPVVLPKDVKFGKGNPLETNEEWINVKCPKCGGESKREVETMDTFVNSSWYFMRYCDPNNSEKIFDENKVKLWCPVDSYIGGAEHACMHLIYSRFYTKFLRDLGLIDFDEPAVKLFHQGMLMGEDGMKMSKSKGNVVLPETVSEKYGIDTARFFLSNLASPDKDIDWSDKGIIGSLRFMKKILAFVEGFKEEKDSEEVEVKLNNVIKNVTGYYGNYQYRKATIEIRELFDLIIDKGCSKKCLMEALQLLSPICPHIAEELWEKIGGEGFISKSEWPSFDENKLKIAKKEIDLNAKVVENVGAMIKRFEEKGAEIKKVYLYVIPFELSKYNVSELKDKFGKEVEVYSVKDADKYDPENKSKKARPGQPSVYFE